MEVVGLVNEKPKSYLNCPFIPQQLLINNHLFNLLRPRTYQVEIDLVEPLGCYHPLLRVSQLLASGADHGPV
jgi:hypothetical protein